MTSIRLLDVRPGAAAVRVVALPGQAATQDRRLDALGLRVGSRLEVVQHGGGGGGLLVAVNGHGRIAVDRATAAAVQVVSWEEPEQSPALTIAALRPGERGRILSLGKGDPGYRRRLLAMGLTPGVEVELTRVAPLGDPVELKVRGFAMSLRKGEADLLRVERQS
jgi:ferrous iron transport protein A